MIDVTRCKIPHPSDCPWEYYSVKDGFPVLKYEVILSISQPYRILSISCPYKGSVSDKLIFDRKTLGLLGTNELLLADSGYFGGHKLITPYKKPKNGHRTVDQMKFNTEHARKRASGERINQRLKNFKVIRNWERRDFNLHHTCVTVIAKILNVAFVYEPL
jgi:hypothetical protein